MSEGIARCMLLACLNFSKGRKISLVEGDPAFTKRPLLEQVPFYLALYRLPSRLRA